SIGRQLGMRPFRARRVDGLDLPDRHPELERMDAHLGLDLETRRQHRKALYETPRKYPIARKNVAEAAPEQARKQPIEQLVPKHMSAPVRLLGFVPASSDDHVELFGDEQ